MSTSASSPVEIVCCSIFRAELGALCERHWPELPVHFVDSALHTRPPDLEAELNKVLREKVAQGVRVALIYGDCCAGMSKLQSLPGICRVQAINCTQLLLGKEEHRRLSREGAFFLTSEWTGRWKDIFVSELGLNEENAHSLMREMHTKLIYLDTGLLSVPRETLEECSRFCGLPWEVLPVSMEHLRVAIQETLSRLELVGGAA